MPKKSPSSTFVKYVLDAVGDAAASVMIFGSHARCDATIHSDIDVLVLSKTKTEPYKFGPISISPYTPSALSAMAVSGSVFVLHLLTDGVLIRDRDQQLQLVLDRYVAPSSYEEKRDDLRCAAGMLDIDKTIYASRWKEYGNVAMYIIRSIMYIKAIEEGVPEFSVDAIATRWGRPDIRKLIEIKYAKQAGYERFSETVGLIEELLEVTVVNPYKTTEALVVNVFDKCPLAAALGIQVIAGEKVAFAYEIEDALYGI